MVVVALVPPLGDRGPPDRVRPALQFSLLAIALPALVALGAPWRRLRLAGRAPDAARLADRLADRRRRHRELAWSLGFIACDLVVGGAWHTPARWPRRPVTVAGAVEAVTPAASSGSGSGSSWWRRRRWCRGRDTCGAPCWPPSPCGCSGSWPTWSGLSNHGFYRSFHHVAGGLSAAADQQIASAVLWFAATVAFVPVIFWNALQWLKTEEDPDTELQALARENGAGARRR